MTPRLSTFFSSPTVPKSPLPTRPLVPLGGPGPSIDRMSRIALLPLLLLLPSWATAQAPFLHDTFSDGEAASQNLPASARWQSATPALVSVEGGALHLRAGDAPVRHVAARFAPTAAPVNLAVGQGVTLTFDLTPMGDIQADPNAIRMALLDSAGQGLPDGRNTRVGHRGYAVLLNSTAGRFRTMRRTGESGALISSLTAPAYVHGPVENAAKNGHPLLVGRTHQMSMFIFRVSESRVEISARVEATEKVNSAVFSDLEAPFTAFDTVVIALGSGVQAALIDNVQVSLTSLAQP